MATKLYDNYVAPFEDSVSDDMAINYMRDRNYINVRRPYLPERGPNADIPCVTINTGKWTRIKGEKVPIKRQERIWDLVQNGNKYNIPMSIVMNATSSRRDDWIQVDTEAQTAYRNRLKLVADLQRTVQVGGFDGWGKLTYEYDAMSDAHEAIVDMDGLSEGRSDGPLFLPRSVPLPFTHSDFWYSDRVLSASGQNGRTRLNVYSAEMAGRRVAEKLEDTAIGIETGITYGTRTVNFFPHDLTSTVFGLTNYTNRNTKTNFTTPTSTNGPTSYAEFLAAFETLYLDFVYGPFAIYHSTEWTQFMNSPFSTAGGNHPSETLRTMLLKHPDVASVERLDRLTGLTGGNTFTVLIVALDRKYIRFINGMELRTWQWDTRGGQQHNYKVGVVQATLPMSDFTGKSGILHGTTA